LKTCWITKPGRSSEGNVKQVELVSGRGNDKFLVAKLKGLDDRDEARLLAGYEICVPRNLFPELTDGEYYWYQLEGLKVIDTSDNCSGRSITCWRPARTM
jgi:16S rRNA processing protein RimM